MVGGSLGAPHTTSAVTIYNHAIHDFDKNNYTFFPAINGEKTNIYMQIYINS